MQMSCISSLAYHHRYQTTIEDNLGSD